MNNLLSALLLRKGLVATLLAVSALTACSSGKWGFPYRAPVQQGNWITEDQIALLQVGMTPEQVRYALGTPTLTDIFHAERWDYPFYFKPGYGDPVLTKFSVWFDQKGLLARWEGDQHPNFQPSDYETQQLWRPNTQATEAKASPVESTTINTEETVKTVPLQ